MDKQTQQNFKTKYKICSSPTALLDGNAQLIVTQHPPIHVNTQSASMLVSWLSLTRKLGGVDFT